MSRMFLFYTLRLSQCIVHVYSKPCEVEYKYLEDGTKVRVSTRSGCVIPKPPKAEEKEFKSHIGKRKT